MAEASREIPGLGFFLSWALFWQMYQKLLIICKITVSFPIALGKIVCFVMLKTVLHYIKMQKGTFHLYCGVRSAGREICISFNLFIYISKKTRAGQRHNISFHTFSATSRVYTPDTENGVYGPLSTLATERWRFPMILENNEVLAILSYLRMFLSEFTVSVHIYHFSCLRMFYNLSCLFYVF